MWEPAQPGRAPVIASTLRAARSSEAVGRLRNEPSIEGAQLCNGGRRGDFRAVGRQAEQGQLALSPGAHPRFLLTKEYDVARPLGAGQSVHAALLHPHGICSRLPYRTVTAPVRILLYIALYTGTGNWDGYRYQYGMSNPYNYMYLYICTGTGTVPVPACKTVRSYGKPP